MKQAANSKLMMVLLSLNAAILLLVVLVLLSRSELSSAAMAQNLPAATPGQVIVSPGQLSTNTWGCYVLDTRTGTLCVYQYAPGDKMLRLQAARGYEQDLQLRSFNTAPLPAEISDLVAKERRLQSGLPATQPAGQSGKN